MSAATTLPASGSGSLLLGIRRVLRLVWLTVRAELRNPGLWLPALLAALAVGAFSWGARENGPSAALILAARAGQGFGLAACLWFAYRAVRDQDERLGAVLRSKPVDGALWVVVNWAAGMVVWALVLALAFLTAVAALWLGAGTDGPAAGWAAVLALGQAAVTLLIAGTLSFGLSRMMRSPLGGILIVLAWFCIIAGLQNAPITFRPEFGQNRLQFLAAAGGTLVLSAWVVERFRRRELRRPMLPVLSALLFLPLTWAGARQATQAALPATEPKGTVWEAMGRQYLSEGQQMPGFWLPDGRGGTLRTSDHRGKILLVYLFSAEDLDTARNLRLLNALQAEHGARGVQVLGVCFSPDHSAGALLSRSGGYHFPIGSDLTVTPSSEKPQSTLATVFNLQSLPALVVTDRRRVARHLHTGAILDMKQVEDEVKARLAEEPL